MCGFAVMGEVVNSPMQCRGALTHRLRIELLQLGPTTAIAFLPSENSPVRGTMSCPAAAAANF